MTIRKTKTGKCPRDAPRPPLLLLLAALLCVQASAATLDYSETVGRLGNACPRLESCEHLRNSGRGRTLTTGVKERNCACDYLCARYGDCCVDAPFLRDHDDEANSSKVSCLELKHFGGVYVVDGCPAGFRGESAVRRLCEASDPRDRTDPLASMPATDARTGLTYKNAFCALCHGRAEDEVVLWSPRLECPLLALFNTSRNGHALTDAYVLENLATDGKGAWGLYLENGAEGNGSLFFHDCDVDPSMPPLLESKIRLCRPDLLSDCDPEWPGDEATRRLCHSYMGARFVHGGHGYRNVHCALCNGVNVTHLSCQSAELRAVDLFRKFATHSFALLLDVHRAHGDRVGQVRACATGQVFDPFFKRCRSLTCLPGYVRVDGHKCAPTPPDPDEVVSFGNVTGNNNATTYEHSPDIPDLNLSDPRQNASSDEADSSSVARFLDDCLLISLGEGDYEMLPNRTLYVPRYGRAYRPTEYYSSEIGSVLVCSHLEATEHRAKFLPLLGYVTVVGLGVSMVFLVLHFVAFCAVPELRNLSGRNLASQCAALFCAYLCFVAGQFESLGADACALVAFLTYYFFQVSFFWMATMAFDVWRTLRMATTELRVSSGRQTRRFLAYSACAWLAPALNLALLACAEYTELFPDALRPGFRAPPPCWFKRRRSLMAFFAAPLLLIMLANVALFLASSRMIVVTRRGGRRSAPRRNYKLYLRLALLMGLTWTVGLVAGGLDVPFLFYAFVVLNTLQGLFVFVAFSCSSKVLAHLRDRLGRPLGACGRPREFKSSSSGNSAGTAASTSSSFNLTKPTTA